MNFRYEQNDFDALKDFDLEASQGEFILLAGASGSGKTTVTRLLNGLIPHFFEGELSGTVDICGVNPGIEPLWKTAHLVGSVFQNPRSQFFTTDSRSEIAFGCENLGFSIEKTQSRVDESLKDFDFESLMERSVFALSGGEKQRLACAAVDAIKPKIFVLDEPSANLDWQATQRLADTLAKWKNDGATVVVAEHRTSYLRGLVDRAVLIDSGRIKATWSGDSFRSLRQNELSELGLRNHHGKSRAQRKILSGKSQQTGGLNISNLSFSYPVKKVPGTKKPLQHQGIQIEQLRIPKGKITALTGDNGAGKTTLVRILAGLQKPSRGNIHFEGKRLSRSALRREIFLVLQDVNHQLITESVGDEIDVTLRLANKKSLSEDDILMERHKILEEIDLNGFEQRHPMSLSGGQKQRLAIGTALASGRNITLLDEPTSGLDLEHMNQVAAALRRLSGNGHTVLVVTHDEELVEACADNRVSLSQGRCINPQSEKGWVGEGS